MWRASIGTHFERRWSIKIDLRHRVMRYVQAHREAYDMLREQRPPLLSEKPGAQSNRPNSTSALSSYYHLASYACVAWGTDDQLTRKYRQLLR